MPTYEDLRSYFEESPELQTLTRRASEVQIVTGFTLDVNPVWSLFYDLEEDLPGRAHDLSRLLDWSFLGDAFFSEYFYLYLESELDGAIRYRWYRPYGWLWWHWRFWRYQGYRRRDLRRHVNEWDRFVSWLGVKVTPVTLTIAHRPIRSPLTERANEVDDQEERRRLIAIVRESAVAARIEERPFARLSLTQGDKIKTNLGREGTLGGILEDPQTNKLYGVTCAHVAALGSTVTDRSGQVLGTCIADTPRVTLPGSAVCDPVILATPARIPGNGPHGNMLDCALIELNSAVKNQNIAGVAQSLSPGQNVVLQGAITKKTRHKLGSLCLSYSFTESGSQYCFRDTIEIWPQPHFPIGGKFGRLTAKVPTQGDSGGWVTTEDDQTPTWAALFFGEDGYRGFAIRASWVYDWAKSTTGCALNP